MRYSLMYFFVFALQSPLVSAQTLSEKIDALINNQLPHATLGIVVKDAQTGSLIYSKNADKLLYPASSTKLFTTAAALYQLKPDFRFLTTLSQKGDDIYLTFSGSPSLTDKNLADLVLSLKNNQITTINGNIIIDSQKFKAPYHPGGVSYDDLGWYYTAPVTSIVLNENAEVYSFISAKELGKPVEIKPKNPANALTIINDLITVSKEDAKNHCDLNVKLKPDNTLHFFGCLAQTKDPKIMSLAIPNPYLYANRIIKDTLDKNQIVLKGTIIKGQTPKDVHILAQYQSKDLSNLINHMLKESDNLYANTLTKELGYNVMDKGSHKQGMFALKKILKQHTHVDLNQVDLADGMGTRYNLSTPNQMTILLSDLYNDANLRPIMLKVLPEAGVSGTLKDRMKKTALEKKVFAKTGTMHDVSSLSGYLIAPDDKTYIFTIMINGINKPINNAKKLEEQILLAVDESLAPALSKN